MKAHVRTPEPTALVWNFAPDRPGYAQLQSALGGLGIKAKPVGSAHAGSKISYLLGLPGASEAALLLHLADDAYPPALILNGVTGARLDTLLARLKADGVNIPLKAVVTPTSVNWPLCQLLAELMQEHTQLSGGK